MSASPAPVPLETLLTHRTWVRRLATSLVRDDASADDVEQRTWMAAMRHPPHDVTTVRAWLARVVRNQALNSRRAETRREAHERTAARPEAARSAGDVVAEAETHKRVVLAVFALAEPYRSTVLLRWFEDLPPRTVAERMGVPVETVRTRLRRAHEALRERLGRGGGGSAGCALALGPLLLGRTEITGTAGWTVGATAGGGTIMGTKTAYVVAAVALAFSGGLAVREVAGDDSAATANEEIEELRGRVAALDAERTAAQASRGASPRGGRSSSASSGTSASDATRIDALETSLAAANARIESLAASVSSKAVAATPAARNPAAEVARLQAMTDDQVSAWIDLLTSSELRNVPVDGQAILDACGILLARPLAPSKRSRALSQKGIGHRALRDWAGAEAAFREAASVAGDRTPEGRYAIFQLAWEASRRGEARAAAESFQAIAENSEERVGHRARCRLYAATHFATAGESDRSTAQYRAAVEEYGASEDTEARKVADLAREELRKAALPAGR